MITLVKQVLITAKFMYFDHLWTSCIKVLFHTKERHPSIEQFRSVFPLVASFDDQGFFLPLMKIDKSQILLLCWSFPKKTKFSLNN